jgi:hypothetical protein
MLIGGGVIRKTGSAQKKKKKPQAFNGRLESVEFAKKWYIFVGNSRLPLQRPGR